ncbi:MAG: hypothetical protein KDN22_08620 [Verrucomicrobiae bacterium]|nr:hypothetical protein [Verrucomicrobiae bacterium]
MIVYLIFSVFFAIAFSSAAKQRGNFRNAIWILPLAAGSGVFAGTAVAQAVVFLMLPDEESLLRSVLSAVIQIAGLGLFFSIIARRWKRLKT